MTEIHQHRLSNGVTILAEPMPAAQSLSMTVLTPAGVACEPRGQQGVATMLAEMICRGAGPLNSKAHVDALDQLGVHRGTNVETHHLRLSATMIGSRLREALPLLLDMIRRPMLPADALEPARDLALQDIDALEDEPQEKVFVGLRQRHYPQPFGRSLLGEREHLEALTLEQIRQYWQQAMTPDRTIIGFAGRFDWNELRDQVSELLELWRGEQAQPRIHAQPQRGYHHEAAQSTQVHIGLAYDALPQPHEQSILQRVAVSVLSGGMSGRLFTQVREERGLCYSVYASYAASRDRGAVLCYAGTTAPRAQETLDVLTHELHKLSEGVQPGEFHRAVVGMKSRLIMQGESSGARASAIAADQFIYGRPRTLGEIAQKIDAVKLDNLNDFVRKNPPGEMTLVTVGPAPLQTPQTLTASAPV